MAIQKAAREVAEFIGLGDFTFIIGVAKQKEGFGGHIQLNWQDKDVFIEIASDAVHFPRPLPQLSATKSVISGFRFMALNVASNPKKKS